LARALGSEPSLVITEMRMPFIDDVALCELLRRDSTTSDMPIVVVTTESRPAALAQAAQVGADVVLTKPVVPEDVIQAAMTLLRSSKARRRAASATVAAVCTERSRSARSERTHTRFDTTTPTVPPPVLICPSCDGSLTYDHSHIGGVSERNAEQWDYYDCSTCGTFQYRHRTRKLRGIQ
jgi:CheY-like chemotaxis protein